MRERQRIVISRETGDASMTTEVIDDDAGFAQRARELQDTAPDIGQDTAPDIGPVEARSLTVLCDGCGTRTPVDFDHPQLPAGWVTTEAGDFCPGCQVLN